MIDAPVVARPDQPHDVLDDELGRLAGARDDVDLANLAVFDEDLRVLHVRQAANPVLSVRRP